MERAWSWAKEHPYATAGIIFVVGLALVLLFGGLFSSAPAAANNTDADQYAAYQAAAAQEAQSGNALAALQSQLQAADNATQAGVTTDSQNDSTAATVAQIQATQATNEAQIAADGANEVAQTNADATEATSTAAVQVNANNDQTNLLQNILNTLTVENQGFSWQGNGESAGAPGATVSGSYSLTAGGGASFSASVAPVIVDPYAGNLPFFMTDPSGQIYGLEANLNEAPPSSALSVGQGSFYVPTGTTVSTTKVATPTTQAAA